MEGIFLKDLSKMVVTLLVISMISGLVLAVTYENVYPKILANNEAKLIGSLKVLFPESNDFKEIVINDNVYYKAVKDGKMLGMAGSFTNTGFNGDITFVVGVDTSGEVAGVELLGHTETPGLGARIADESFISQFKGKMIDEAFLLGEDVDGITGATISSRAITDGIKNAANELASVLDKIE